MPRKQNKVRDHFLLKRSMVVSYVGDFKGLSSEFFGCFLELPFIRIKKFRDVSLTLTH